MSSLLKIIDWWQPHLLLIEKRFIPKLMRLYVYDFFPIEYPPTTSDVFCNRISKYKVPNQKVLWKQCDQNCYRLAHFWQPLFVRNRVIFRLTGDLLLPKLGDLEKVTIVTQFGLLLLNFGDFLVRTSGHAVGILILSPVKSYSSHTWERHILPFFTNQGPSQYYKIQYNTIYLVLCYATKWQWGYNVLNKTIKY